MSVRRFGSDLVVDFLDAAGITHVALNPGASFRGLHDSLAAAGKPEIIVALHEEIAVALAHGYAKSAGRPMAVFLHDQVGLQHAAMALFNAFVDAVPMLVIGGTGPRDTTHKRPWVDWIHSGHPDAAVIRDVVKWDDEPVSLDSLGHSLARGLRIATTPPMGPVYIGIDALLQEQDAEGIAPYVVPSPVPPVTAPRAAIADIAHALAGAQHPAIVVDRGAPGLSRPLRSLVEHLGIAVVDLGGRSFPSDHWADRTTAWEQVLAEADVVLAIELRDVAWGLTRVDVSDRSTVDLTAPGARIVAIGLTELRHRGYMQLEGLSPGVERLTGEATTVVTELYEAVLASGVDPAVAATRRASLEAAHDAARADDRRLAAEASDARPITPAHLAASLGQAIGEDGWQLANGLLGNWPRRLWKTRDETTYLGRSGGEGLGYGLPASIGAALAQRGSRAARRRRAVRRRPAVHAAGAVDGGASRASPADRGPQQPDLRQGRVASSGDRAHARAARLRGAATRHPDRGAGTGLRGAGARAGSRGHRSGGGSGRARGGARESGRDGALRAAAGPRGCRLQR